MVLSQGSVSSPGVPPELKNSLIELIFDSPVKICEQGTLELLEYFLWYLLQLKDGRPLP